MNEWPVECICESISCGNRGIAVRTNEYRLLVEQLAARFHQDLLAGSTRLIALVDYSIQSVKLRADENFDIDDLLSYRANLETEVIEELETWRKTDSNDSSLYGEECLAEFKKYVSKEPSIRHIIVFPNCYDVDGILEPKNMDMLQNDERYLNGVFLFICKPSPWSWADQEDLLLWKTAPTFVHELEGRSERIRQISHLLANYNENPINEQSNNIPLASELGMETLRKNASTMRGLSRNQMERALRHSIYKTGTLDSELIGNWRTTLFPEGNEEVISGPGEGQDVILDIKKTTETFDDIVGINPLKDWCKMMAKRFQPGAKEYGFTRYPKGLLLTGVPGCGKSSVAKALSNEMGIPYTQLEADRFHQCFVGEGEKTLRETLNKLEAQAPLVCFIDEAEKAFASVTSETAASVGFRMLMSMLLQFIEDNRSGVFWVFTSNQIELFPPELVDRFDGRFFIDLPNTEAREKIIQLKLRAVPKIKKDFKLDNIVKISEGFSGRNIEDAIHTAMSSAFMQNQVVQYEDLELAFSSIRPTSVTMGTKINSLRELVEKGQVQLANDEPYKASNQLQSSDMFG
jgi:AAA+ superfamily predicted ATPase